MHDEQINSEGWRDQLIVSKSGAVKPLLANAIAALRNAPAWTSVICYDVFANETVLENAPPWETSLHWDERKWTPHDDLMAADWLQRNDISVTSAVAAQAVEAVARDRSFHPVVEYLNSVQHDGTPRLDSWLSTFLGTEPSLYYQTVGRCMLIAAVARILDPGCKVDTVPILEGPQGARKSTAVKALFYPWFTDELADLGSKDASMQTRGMWGIEVSELDAMSRGEVSRIKAFISRTTDRFRPPYGNRVIESPRACVFWGTTNSEGYLKDETGGRRFWPVKVGKIDIEGLQEIRDQLWAEARDLYLAGAAWWISNPNVQQEAEQQQLRRYIGDPWDRDVEQYIDSVLDDQNISVRDILVRGLNLDIHRCGQVEQNRVSRILRSLGLVRVQVRSGDRSGDRRVWVYRKLVTKPSSEDAGSNVTTLRPVTTPIVVTKESPAPQALSPLSPLSPLNSKV